ncbi:MAG: CPBP family intramembrane glutamic endopeptidase [Tepidisphaeraceae bacterium]
MSKSAGRPSKQVERPAESVWARYASESESAFAALVFILPFVIAYELGTRYITLDPASHTEQRIVAFSMLRNSLAALGATAHWVAPAAVVSVLISLGITRKERFQPRISTQLGMALESVALAAPLLGLSLLIARIRLLAGPEPMSEGVVLSIGAGIYEEFIFRLLGLVALHFFVVDFLGIRAIIGTVIAVMGSGVLFSLYHYWGSESFAIQTFVFRAMAGAYFGSVMLSRGFGVTVGCHMAYDIAICCMRESLTHRG